MTDDPALIWERATVSRERHPSRRARLARPVEPGLPSAGQAAGTARITVREAGRRFSVPLSTLRSWCRSGQIDAVMQRGPNGQQWMVSPASVAAHIRRRSSVPAPTGATRSGPIPDGTAMLVPRAAWDRMMDQLGNLHQAGQQLAEARERAARAETEAAFLRERLAEMRLERGHLIERLDTGSRVSEKRQLRPLRWLLGGRT